MSNLTHRRSRLTSNWITAATLTVLVGGFGIVANNIVDARGIQTTSQSETCSQFKEIAGMGIVELGNLNVVSTFLYN